MDVFDDKGICVRGSEKFYIDSSKAGCKSIISHAHSDHAKLTAKGSYIMTPETAALIGEKAKKAEIRKLKYGEKTKIGDFDVSLHNAGHILGAAQILAEKDGERVGVTADFKLQKSLLFEPAEIMDVDTLVMETTFGLPQFSFPKREHVYEMMIKWMQKELSKNHFIVLAGYATGKAQELTKVVNEFLGETPLVHERIYENNKVYEKFGVNLGKYIKLNHNLNDSNVLIMPPSLINAHLTGALKYTLQRNVVSALASGWGFNGTFNKCFPLSDHADFKQLVRYVKESNPKLLLTHHGFAGEFAGYVNRKLKIPARALNQKGQRCISEFSS